MSGADDHRVVLVTGGASGIGLATAARFAADGAAVVVADRVVPDGVLDGVAELSVELDVTDEGAVDALLAEVLDRYGRLDAAANCAGVSGTYGATVDLSLDAWRRTIDVNLTGTFLCLRAELRAMAGGTTAGTGATDGRAIVNVSSGAGTRGFANLPDYVASKHAVIGLTRSVALEVARSGIRVNAVCPGSVRTPMLAAFVGGDADALDKMGRMSPIGRLGTPEEIAEAIVWLCSDSSRFVTGVALGVDGGVSAA